MNRRDFFRRTLGAVVVAGLAPLLPKSTWRWQGPPLPDIDPKVFAGMFNPSADIARQYREGVSVRLIRQYKVDADRSPMRMDCLYGFATVQPQFAVRIEGA